MTVLLSITTSTSTSTHCDNHDNDNSDDNQLFSYTEDLSKIIIYPNIT
eukprot:CAMPEP_0203682108 /NCGR_PEP_ID=MMETSP0090-20130426/44764_1 /ASSEMBLY_ACC=CAM_ASM_001088 /TAXON_ID=426623 /ORGANISM="Chaetoceros affinis, Strain CCMP159" /LENGTH=47 /DNA_ID= /DNA_START= /DNA_END= /DNA_ORIENTATION=